MVLSGLRKNDILTMRWEHVGEDRIYPILAQDEEAVLCSDD